jgi:hypothetical protein
VRLFPDKSRTSRCRSFAIWGGTEERALWLRYRLIRNVNEKRPDVGGMVFRLTPPISSEFQVFSGGRVAVGRGASAMGATVEEGWFAFEDVGDVSGAGVDDEGISLDPFNSAFARFGFVIGIADFATVREAIALARAR